MAGTEKRRSTKPRNTARMGLAATADSTSEWRELGAQVKVTDPNAATPLRSRPSPDGYEKRGQVSVELGGDLAAFLYLSEPAEDGTSDSRTAVAQGGNGRSGGSMGTLVAGTGFEPVTFRL
jgi:hypothetical protein